MLRIFYIILHVRKKLKKLGTDRYNNKKIPQKTKNDIEKKNFSRLKN